MKKARNNPEFWEKAMANAAIEGLMTEHDSDMHYECQVMNERCIYELRKVYWRNVFQMRKVRDSDSSINDQVFMIGTFGVVNQQILSQITQLQPVGRKMCGEFKQSENER